MRNMFRLVLNNFETMKLQDLIGYEYQKQELLANTKAFVEDKPANNVLLVGARGTGKSFRCKSSG